MKKVIGVVFILLGIICIPKVITPDVYETIGGIIGISLVAFLPAFLLLRNKKKDENND